MKARRKTPVQLVTTEPQHCSIGLRLKILGRLPFFAGLSIKALERVNQRFIEIGLQMRDLVYAAGDPAERLYVVAEGKVKLLQHAAGGRNVLLDILTTGEFFGNLAILGVAAYPDTAQAQTPACVLSIRSDDFQQILDEHPKLALKALSIMAERLTAANQRVLQLSSMPVDQRIAVTLLALGKKLGRRQAQGLLIDTPFSREDLADMTGATPETVTRVMSQLQSAGIIESGRQWVAITNVQALEDQVGNL
jgi:CRP-like cAMP-binding protein